jgi:quinoprotein glucose dehydrogenase
MSRSRLVLSAVAWPVAALVAIASGAMLAQSKPGRMVEWPVVGGDAANTRSSTLTDITPDNLPQLKRAWQWKHGETANAEFKTVPGGFETTPLMADDVLYVTTPYNGVAALDADTGRELWRFEGQAYRLGQIPTTGFKHRGAALWRGGSTTRIFLNTRDRLYSLDAKTGKPSAGFGQGGSVSLLSGFSRPIADANQVTGGSPPVVYKDIVIVGHAVPDRYQLKNDPPGIVQAFDARTGRRLWVFNVIPQSPDEFGADSWEGESWRTTGHANVWAPMTLDSVRGIVYLPTSTPSDDLYGGRRPGANLLAESIVAVDAVTGLRKWHFQTVHHGLWDYDNPAAPNLVTVTVGGRRIDAVAQITKQGFTFVFDRVTGQPVFPIEERSVATDSDVPGEKVFATQPFPTRPPAMTPQGVSLDDANDLTPEVKALATEELRRYRLGPLYTPPSLGGTLMRPGSGGGANWGGAAFDAGSGLLFVRASTATSVMRVAANDGSDPFVDAPYSNMFGPAAPASRLGSVPLVKPPYATLTALDLNSGTIAWQVPAGEGSAALRKSPLLNGATLPDRLGNPESKGGAIVTGSGLVFMGGGDGYLYAFDKRNGRELWRGALPPGATATPMTYRTRAGRQFVAIATGAGPEGTLVAYALP